MSNHADRTSNQQSKSHTPTGHGSDWVALNRDEMRARRAAQARRDEDAEKREAERQARIAAEDADILGHDDELLGIGPQPTTPPAPTTSAGPRTRPRPSALIHQLDIENLRSLRGKHEVPLAPLTLVYGPNAAGKSTLMKALTTFMKVVDTGRRDALRAWDAAAEDRLWTQISYIEPIREGQYGEVISVERPRLSLGVDFQTRSGEFARAELEYEVTYLADTFHHASAIGLRNGQLSRKEFTLQDPDLYIDPGEFGRDALLSFKVSEQDEAGAWQEEVRVFDPELFARAPRPLKADIFAMAFLLRHLGPHRGAPGSEYVPMQGPFNTGWMDGYDKRGIAGFDEYELLNQMMSQLELPYEFEAEPAATLKEKLKRKWTLKDTRSQAPVDLDHVGYGVGQLLPVIDVCIHAYKQVICVEEPEIHLHPRLQSKLGNLFAFSVLNRGNQVILETHSESILLRVRRLIRRGELRPEEVSLLYVDNSDQAGATVRRLRLGTQGELLDPWPGGFFDDALDDVLGGWQ